MHKLVDHIHIILNQF